MSCQVQDLGFPKTARHRQVLARLPATAGLAAIRQAEDRFDEFILAIANELNAGTPINYQARRAALSGWELDEETWQRLAAEARTRTSGRHLAHGPHDDIDRLAASVAIWQCATHGYYRYAPLLKAAPADWFRRRDRVTWKILSGSTCSSPVGTELHRLLNEFADQLSHRIDARWHGDESRGRVAAH